MQKPARGIHYSRLDTGKPVTIALIGCGGTGSSLLTHLARLHKAHLACDGNGLDVVVYDGDNVSEANIGRQNFAPCDVGQNKANVLVTRLNAYFGMNWRSVPSHFTKNTMRNTAIYISCVDSAAARVSIGKAITHMSSSYWLDCGNMQTSGQVILGGTFKPIKNVADDVAILPSVLDMYPDLLDPNASIDDDSGPSCSLAEALQSQDIMINPMISGMASQLIWTLIRHGKLQFHAMFTNLATGHMRPMPILKPTKATKKRKVKA